jgi:hypothetical protein
MIPIGKILVDFYGKFMRTENIYFTLDNAEELDNHQNVVSFTQIYQQEAAYNKEYEILCKFEKDGIMLNEFIRALDYFSESITKVVHYEDKFYAIRIVKNTPLMNSRDYDDIAYRYMTLNIGIDVTEIHKEV